MKKHTSLLRLKRCTLTLSTATIQLRVLLSHQNFNLRTGLKLFNDNDTSTVFPIMLVRLSFSTLDFKVRLSLEAFWKLQMIKIFFLIF